MKRFNLPLVADTALAALCAFILFFTLVRYYFSTAAGLAAGIISAIAAGTGAYFYIRIKQHKKFILSADKAAAEKLSAHLWLLPPEKATELFSLCLEEAKLSGRRAETADSVYFTDFAPEPSDRNALSEAARFNTDKKKFLVCNSASSACSDAAEKLGIKIITSSDVYAELEKRGKLPEKYLYEEKAHTRFFAKIKARFTRKLCLPAFWSGTALLFFSYFTFYPVYYIIAGALLLSLCAAAAVFGQSKSM